MNEGNETASASAIRGAARRLRDAAGELLAASRRKLETRAAGRRRLDRGQTETPLFDGSEESFRQWKLVGSGAFDREADRLRLAAGSERGLAYYAGGRFEDFRLRLEFCPDERDFDMSVAVRFLDPDRPVPDRDDPSIVYPYDNEAYVAQHTGFAVRLGTQPTVAEPGTFEGVLLGDAPGAQLHAERAEVRIGAWNELELEVQRNHFSARLNGKETARFSNSDRYRGKPASGGPNAGFVGLLMRKGSVSLRGIEMEEIHVEPPGEPARSREPATEGA